MIGRGRRKSFNSRKKCSCSESEPESKSHDHAKKNIMKRKSNSKSCKVISKLLPEDLMLGILSRVPLKCLLNSARYVCKLWAATIGSSHFAEAHLHCTHSKPGFYVENFMSKSNSYFLDIKDNINGQFEKIGLGTPPRMGDLISTCDGILLLCNGVSRIFVVNPILKCWIRIPPLPISKLLLRHKFTIARVPRTSTFKLFFVDVLKVSGVDWYVLYVLRIGIDNSWKEIARKKTLLKGRLSSFWEEPIYSGGNDLYWITREEVIVMDVDKEIIVGEYPLPPPPLVRVPVGTFLWMGNCLSCIVHKVCYKTFQIYILDIDSEKWTLYHEMGPTDYVVACGHEFNIFFVEFCFWINDQIIFQVVLRQRDWIFTGLKGILFGYNVKTRQLTKMEGIAEGNFRLWLHTNSLISLPSTPT